MFHNDHFDEFADCAFRFPDFPADSVVQFQRDSAGDAFQLHSFLAPFSLVFPFWATQAYSKPSWKAIINTNEHSGEKAFTNVTANNAGKPLETKKSPALQGGAVLRSYCYFLLAGRVELSRSPARTSNASAMLYKTSTEKGRTMFGASIELK